MPPAGPAPRVCAVIPTYNESESVGPLVEAIRASDSSIELLFVDDSSPDGTAEVVRRLAAEDPKVHLMMRDSKKGIGSAYIEGFGRALADLTPEIVVEMDADLQHPPATIASLVAAVREGADIAIASRYVEGGGSSGWGLGRRAVSRGANWLARTLLGLRVRDCTSGFRAYSRESAEEVAKAGLPASGFEFQVAVLKLLKGRKMVEVPYTFQHRVAGESKLGFGGMVRFFLAVVRMALS